MSQHPTDDLLRLSTLLEGRWEGTEWLYFTLRNEFHRPAEARYQFTPVRDDSTILLDYTQLISGKVTVRGHGVFRRDPQTLQIVLRWWDSCHSAEQTLTGRLTGSLMVLRTATPPSLAATWIFGPGDTFLTLWDSSRDGTAWETRKLGMYHSAGRGPHHATSVAQREHALFPMPARTVVGRTAQ